MTTTQIMLDRALVWYFPVYREYGVMEKSTKSGSKSISPKELSEMLDRHRLWLESNGAQGQQLDLSGHSIPRANLSGANLSKAVLSGIDLREADLTETDLSGANLEKANLTGGRLQKANLRGASLHGADLSGAYLRDTQLAASDLSSAKFPDGVAIFGEISLVTELSRTTRRIFISMLVACIACWLSLAATTDVQLVTNTGTVQLPVIRMDISISGFYAAAPVLLLILQIYFLTYLQRLWESVAQLPAVFPDATPLGKKLPPFVLTGLGTQRMYCVLLMIVSVGLAFLLIPLTMLFFWLRYLTRHELVGTTWHVLLVVSSIWLSSRFMIIGIRSFNRWGGQEFTDSLVAVIEAIGSTTAKKAKLVIFHSVLIAVGATAPLLAISVGVIWGRPPSYPSGYTTTAPAGASDTRQELETIVPWLFKVLGVNPFADLCDADLSTKPSGLVLVEEKDLELVKGARLQGRNLRYADASGAFLVNADLTRANLNYARLSQADLRCAIFGALQAAYPLLLGRHTIDVGLLNELPLPEQDHYIDQLKSDLNGWRVDFRRLFKRAHLKGTLLQAARLDHSTFLGVNLDGANLAYATLRGADLRLATLRNANLWGADLTDARFRKADLTGADLSFVIGLTQEQIDSAITDPNTKLPAMLQVERDIYVSGSERAISDSVLVQTLEMGLSLIIGHIQGADRIASLIAARTTAVSYRTKVLECIIAGDLESSDIKGRTLALYGEIRRGLLTPGSTYIMFIGKQPLVEFRYWYGGDRLIDVSGTAGSSTIDSFAARAKDVYEKTAINRFRNEKIDPNVILPKLPAPLIQACLNFKAHPRNRCQFARQIVDSELGSGLDQSKPFRFSHFTSSPPRLCLTKSQVILLLGQPTMKIGWSYFYFCGKDDASTKEDLPYGLITVNFDQSSKVKYLGYSNLKEELK